MPQHPRYRLSPLGLVLLLIGGLLLVMAELLGR